MSILETFLILFESNSDDVEKGAKKAEKATDDLEKKLDATDKMGQKAGQSFMGLATAAVAALGAVVSVGAVINGVFAASAIADRVGEASRALSIATEDISAFGDAAKKEGGSLDGFIGTLNTLSSSLAQIDANGKSRISPFLKEIGVSATDAAGKTKEVIPLLFDIAEGLEGMSNQEQVGFGRKLGLDMGTIVLLQQGRRGLEEIIRKQKELGAITERQANIADAYGDQIDDTSVAFRGLFLSIAEFVLPAFTKMMQIFGAGAKLIKDNGAVITYFLAALGTIIGIYVIPPLLAMAAAFLIANAPIIALTAAVAAFAAAIALVFEDIGNFRSGAPSLIGDACVAMAQAFEWLSGTVMAIWDGIKEYIQDSIDAIMRGVREVKEFLGFGGGEDILVQGQMKAFGETQSGIGSQTSNSVVGGNTTSSKSLSIGEVKIETQATNADEIAGSFNKSLQREFDQTLNNSDDGVAA